MKIPLILSAAFLSVIAAAAQEKPSPEAEAFYTKAMRQINPRHVTWIKNTSNEMNARNFPADSAVNKTKTYAVPGGMNNSDIEAVAFLVLMEAYKSAQEDLKAIMARVKAMNDAKAGLRRVMDEYKRMQSAMRNKDAGTPVSMPPGFSKEVLRVDSLKRLAGISLSANTRYTTPVTKSDLDNAVDKAKNDLDSMSEMGEMESLRLQMAMDRMSKMMSTLSSLMKKISKTSDAIIQNLK